VKVRVRVTFWDENEDPPEITSMEDDFKGVILSDGRLLLEEIGSGDGNPRFYEPFFDNYPLTHIRVVSLCFLGYGEVGDVKI
jgi:hypothetical protein